MFRLLSLVLILIFASNITIAAPEILIRPGVVMFSVHPDYKVDLPPEGGKRFGLSEVDHFIEILGATWVEPSFPYCLPPIDDGPNLSLIYNLYFPESISVQDVIRDLSKVEGITRVEPWYIDKLCFDPNDPYYNSQYHLQNIAASQAWDMHRGDRSAVLAIVDTGVQLNHPDLRDNIWVNPGEDLNHNGVIDQNERNNVDDDRNGYIDDFNGWDFVANNGRGDNDPTDVDGHGTHCAGLASGVTNNRVGIASIGFSCSIMAIRAGTGLTITYGYQGVQYAARNGAKVISLSWGGYGGNDFTRQVIEDAQRRGALVVAATGNDGVSDPHYPACYPSVLAVSATDRNDRKAGFSNYGNWVDVCAPGVDILSTWSGSRYGEASGTSMACPIAAGVAILIRAAYPNLTVSETRQLILDGADNIDNLNPNYRGMLGAGRVNAYNSLVLGNRPILTIDTIIVNNDDNNNGQMDPGENVELAVTLSNSVNGQGTDNIRVFLITQDTTLTITPQISQFPNLEPGQRYSNIDSPFMVSISPDAISHTTWINVGVIAEPGNIRMDKTFELLVGHPDILVVDDDDGADQEINLFESIEAMGQGWARWDVSVNYTPDLTTLVDYKMVIWVTGNANPPLDDLDRFQIQSALEERANILLIGNRVGDDEANREMLRDYFGAQHLSDSVYASMCVGLPNHPIDDSVWLILSGGGGSDPRLSPSSMQAVGIADDLLVYKIGQDSIVGLAGVYRTDPFTGSRTMYLGFTFESVSNTRNLRNNALYQMYRWFTSDLTKAPFDDEPNPTDCQLISIYPNPFNNMTKVDYWLKNSGFVRLSVYEMSGRLVGIISEGFKPSGRFISYWNANDLPSGIYLIRLETMGSAPIEKRLMLLK